MMARREDFSLDDEGGAWAAVGQPSKDDKNKKGDRRIIDVIRRKGQGRVGVQERKGKVRGEHE